MPSRGRAVPSTDSEVKRLPHPGLLPETVLFRTNTPRRLFNGCCVRNYSILRWELQKYNMVGYTRCIQHQNRFTISILQLQVGAEQNLQSPEFRFADSGFEGEDYTIYLLEFR